MSTLKVENIRHEGATSDAVVLHNDGTVAITTCTATNLTATNINSTNLINATPLSHRNKFINGAMTISQRATSFTSTLADDQYTLDRFKHIIRGTNDSHYTQVSDHPDNFTKSMKVKCNSTYTPSASDNAGFQSHLEGQDLQDLNFGSANANSFTVSFYAKSASQNNNHQYTFQIRTYPSGGATTRIKNFPFTVTTSWQRFTFTFTGDTGADITSDNQVGMALLWNLNAGPDDITSQYTDWTSLNKFMCVTGQSNFLDNTNNEFYLTGVQLEVGDTATTFEHRSYGEDESRCFRYFFSSIADKYWYNGHGGNVNDYTEISFQTKMRDTPSITFGTAITETNLNLSGGAGHASRAVSTTGWQYGPRSAATGNSYGRINYTADAEL